MRTSSKESRPSESSSDSDAIRTDDGGSGLLEACRARFASPDYQVECDARHTVWVKRADGTRSYGLSPWTVREHSMNELLERVETQLGPPTGKH